MCCEFLKEFFRSYVCLLCYVRRLVLKSIKVIKCQLALAFSESSCPLTSCLLAINTMSLNDLHDYLCKNDKLLLEAILILFLFVAENTFANKLTLLFIWLRDMDTDTDIHKSIWYGYGWYGMVCVKWLFLIEYFICKLILLLMKAFQ